MSMLEKVKSATVDRFLVALRTHGAPGAEAPMLFENPSEEIADAIERGKLALRLHFAGGSANRRGVTALDDMKKVRGAIRAEENYLFASRRYPAAEGNVLPLGNHIPARQYTFFNTKIDGKADIAGYPTGFMVTSGQTNLTAEGQTPRGQGFRIFQEGVSFGMESDPGDIAQILDSGDLIYKSDAQQYQLLKGPMAGWPGGWGVDGFSAVQGKQSAHHGQADPRAVRRVQFPRIIGPQKTFAYVHNVAVAGRPTDGTNWTLSKFTEARVWLWGDQLTEQAG